MQSASAFVTNEYAVQSSSRVYNMLISQPAYFTYVPNPQQAKTAITLNAWTRTTPFWHIQCEWNNVMSRETASGYYAQEF